MATEGTGRRVHEPLVRLDVKTDRLDVEWQEPVTNGDRVLMSVELFNMMIDRFNHDN